ncbi:MAG: DUF1552 domain-containing protein [Gemmataceae bacterium]
MSNLHSPRPRPLSRRTFLRGTGVAMGLPLLEAMTCAAGKSEPPRRMVCIETNMGILPQFFFPEKAGRDFTLTPYLEKLKANRDQITVFSGTSHPGVTGGHAAEKCFLTGTPHPERGGFRNWVSLDQFAAEQFGNRTRYPSLTLGVGQEGQTLSYTRSGAPSRSNVAHGNCSRNSSFKATRTKWRPRWRNRQGRSTLDFVGEQAKQLNGRLAPADRQRLDQYLTSVRDLEQRLASAEDWEKKPKPKTAAKPPDDEKDAREFARQTQIMTDVVKLALETDSTLLVSLFIDTTVIHNITHHGNRPEVLAELRAKEEAQFEAFGGFLKGLSAAKEADHTLLDRTMVLYGTCRAARTRTRTPTRRCCSPAAVSNTASIGFRQGEHYPLTNLFVSMLQRLGIETREFSTGKGTMRGLEMV